MATVARRRSGRLAVASGAPTANAKTMRTTPRGYGRGPTLFGPTFRRVFDGLPARARERLDVVADLPKSRPEPLECHRLGVRPHLRVGCRPPGVDQDPAHPPEEVARPRRRR